MQEVGFGMPIEIIMSYPYNKRSEEFKKFRIVGWTSAIIMLTISGRYTRKERS